MGDTRDLLNAKKMTFKTIDGLTLSALFFFAGNRRPTIIMTNGFSGYKEAFLPDFAARFNAVGYNVIVYDNRCFNESEGMPRNHVDPFLQTRDYSDAFDFATTLPEVDPDRIVFWGSSMSGGNALSAAAFETRVAAVIAQVPFVSGEQASAAFTPFRETFLHDRGDFRRGAPPTMVPVTPATMEEALSGSSRAILKDPAAVTFIEEMDLRDLPRTHNVTLQSSLAMILHEPRSLIHRISPRPLLMVVADKDTTIPASTQLEMFQQARQPKFLHIVKGATHFDPYYGLAFEENVTAQIKFLKEVFA